MARGALKEKLEHWEGSEEDWRSCKAEICLQTAMLETFVSKLPDDVSPQDHAIIQDWTESITRSKLRAAKIENASALSARDFRIGTLIIIDTAKGLFGDAAAAQLSEALALGFGTEGLLPAGQIIEGVSYVYESE